MKVSKYREMISKVDTDKTMDQRIKNQLMFYEEDKHKSHKYQMNTSIKGHGVESFMRSFAKAKAIRPVLTSIVFLAFMVVIILSLRENLTNSKFTPGADGTALGALSEETDGLEEYGNTIEAISIDEAPNTDNTVAPEGVTNDLGTEDTGDLQASEIETNSMDDQNDIYLDLSVDELLSGTEDEPADLLAEANTGEAPVVTTDSNEFSEVPISTEGEFYYAWFDVLTEGNVKAAIPNLILRFYGDVKKIDSANLTDVVLTRDGVPFDNNVTLTKRNNYKWGYEEVTDFYFQFDSDNREPGIYGLTGKYKGEAFTVYNKIIEAPISDEAVNPLDLRIVGWMYFPDENGEPLRISEVVFQFNGNQNSFYQSDLSDLRLTLNGQEIAYSFMEQVFRYNEYNGVDGGETSYNLVFTEEFTQPGTYKLSGYLMGIPFTSDEIVIP
jgi:hypothetical protein